MNREAKVAQVEELTARLQAAPFVAIADYRGVSVAEINAFRRSLEAVGVEYRVIKNTLARRAIAGSDMEPMGDKLTGMVGWVISGEDPIAAAKALRDASKDFEKANKFVLLGGYFDGEVLGGPAVTKVADLPGREELLSTLLATLQEGPRQVLGVIQGPARDLMYLLKNYEQKLEEAGAE